MTRASTWTNADGLVVGFGKNTPQTTGADTKNYTGLGGAKTALVRFTWKDLNLGSTINVPVPKGAKVTDVRLVVDAAFTSTGTNTITVGDGTDPDGYITTAQADTTTLTAGGVIVGAGAYLVADTDTTAPQFKTYTAADTIDLASAQTDWTAGAATVVVTYA
jgi:hypothetical protein